MSGASERLTEMTVGAYAAALASGDPTPGGGSAAATAAAFGAGLTAMVVRLSLDRPAYEQHTQVHEEALERSDHARRRLIELADEDAEAYAGFLRARRLPNASPEESLVRAASIRDAARYAATVPLSVIQECHRQMEVVERVVGRCNVNAACDLEVAALLIECAAKGAAANITVNLPATGDEGFSSAVLVEVDERLRQIQGATARIRERTHHGSRRTPEPV